MRNQPSDDFSKNSRTEIFHVIEMSALKESLQNLKIAFPSTLCVIFSSSIGSEIERVLKRRQCNSYVAICHSVEMALTLCVAFNKAIMPDGKVRKICS